jgi:5-formyltetrahydrofolate cyclo-ligase
MSASSKQRMREALLEARALLSPGERVARSRSVFERVVTLDAFRRAHTVGLYAAIGAEVGTSDLENAAVAAGKRVAWPVLVGATRELAYALCRQGDLVSGPLRTHQPPPDAPQVPLSELELVVVPGVAFDLACRRLGRGRGHFDATLRALSPETVRVGLAFELQIVPEIPLEPHDVPVDLVVTEARTLRAKFESGARGDARPC